MTLFILYQTDQWKSKASRIFFGVFDCRNKAKDCANYYNLNAHNSKILIEEVTLNQCKDK